MSDARSVILATIAVGLGATLLMDLWGLALKHAFGIPFPNYCHIGRWLRHMPEGVFRHQSIGAAPERSAECAVGWIAHYTLGALYALAFVALAPGAWLEQPTVLPALLFGLATLAIPLFVMQPALGMGIAASKAPNPTAARLRSLLNHAAFGVGLYATASCILSARA